MRLPRVRFTIRRLMVVVAVASIAIASLPEPVFFLRVPAFTIKTNPDGSIYMPTLMYLCPTRWGVALVASILLVVGLTAVYIVRGMLRVASRLARPDERGRPPAFPVPRVRLTVRRLMVLVAICAAILGSVNGLASRSAKLTKLADYHHARVEEPYFHAAFNWLSDSPPVRVSPQDSWHLAMTWKYRHAAQYPWLPVAPDSIEPQ